RISTAPLVRNTDVALRNGSRLRTQRRPGGPVSPTKRSDRRRAGDTVGEQAAEALIGAERDLRSRPEDSVDPACRKAAALERELEHGYVPAHTAAPKQTRAEPRPPEAPQGPPRAR